MVNEKKGMPGFEKKIAQDAANAADAQRWQHAAANAERRLKLKKDKLKAIDNIVPPTAQEMANFKSRLKAIASGIKIAGISQLIFFAAGSAAHYFDVNDAYYEEDIDGVTYVHTPNDFYHGASYGQAVKNAYLFDDFIHGNPGGTWQAIAGLIAILVSLELGRRKIKGKFDDIQSVKSENAARQKYIDDIYARLEMLKDYGVRTDNIISSLRGYAVKLVSKMSEMDRGYLGNLLNGGLENANWDVANAIVAGHLKSHPDDYNEIIKIIDEATMDPAIVKKYGRGGITSFGAAQAMMRTRGNEK